MNIKFVKVAALFTAALALFVPVFLIINAWDRVSWWLACWLFLFGLFLFLPIRPESRGFLLIFGSVAIALIGSPLMLENFSEPRMKQFIEMISQFMMITGGAVGANFVTNGLLEIEAGGAKRKS